MMLEIDKMLWKNRLWGADMTMMDIAMDRMPISDMSGTSVSKMGMGGMIYMSSMTLDMSSLSIEVSLTVMDISTSVDMK